MNTDGIRHTLALYFSDARRVRDDLRTAQDAQEQREAVERAALLVVEAGNMVWMLLAALDDVEARVQALEDAQAE